MFTTDAISTVRTTVPAVPDNNFDALRFWCALAVLWSHSFPVSEGSEANEPLFALSGGQTTLGTIAVTFFFVISGFLVTRSFEQSDSVWRFVKARVLRIMPALLVVLFAVAFIVGPLTSTLPLRDYFSSHGPYSYFALQASFLRWHDELPGVFSANPVAFVNGSLWTLRHEVECYTLVLLLGVAGLLNRYVTLVLYCAGVLSLAILDQSTTRYGVQLPMRVEHLDLATKFLAGALVYQWRPGLESNVAWLCLAVALACLLFGNFDTAERTVVPYFVMYLAIGTPRRWTNMIAHGDLSYGTYIYAWPVKQLVVMSTATPHWFTTGSVATPIVLLLAWLSWHGVEKTALSLKERSSRAKLRAVPIGARLATPAVTRGSGLIGHR